jgi:CHRD domain
MSASRNQADADAPGIGPREATLTPEQAQQFSAGEWYINVHTQDHQAGEIRGQMMPPKS